MSTATSGTVRHAPGCLGRLLGDEVVVLRPDGGLVRLAGGAVLVWQHAARGPDRPALLRELAAVTRSDPEDLRAEVEAAVERLVHEQVLVVGP